MKIYYKVLTYYAPSGLPFTDDPNNLYSPLLLFLFSYFPSQTSTQIRVKSNFDKQGNQPNLIFYY